MLQRKDILVELPLEVHMWLDGRGAVSGDRVVWGWVFEDEVKRLLGKRWVATGGALLRTNVNGATSTVWFCALGDGSGGNSGASTPYGHPGGRSAL